MKRKTKIALWTLAGLAAILCLPVVGISMIVGSNFVVGLYSLAFERQPSRSEIAGTYVFKGDGLPTLLRLSQDGSYEEKITESDGALKDISGSWTSRGETNHATVTLSSFLDPSTNAKSFKSDSGKVAVDNFSMLCYKPRFGATYMALDEDTGDRFNRTDL